MPMLGMMSQIINKPVFSDVFFKHHHLTTLFPFKFEIEQVIIPMRRSLLVTGVTVKTVSKNDQVRRISGSYSWKTCVYMMSIYI